MVYKCNLLHKNHDPLCEATRIGYSIQSFIFVFKNPIRYYSTKDKKQNITASIRFFFLVEFEIMSNAPNLISINSEFLHYIPVLKLKQELTRRNLSVEGNKSEVVQRLKNHCQPPTNDNCISLVSQREKISNKCSWRINEDALTIFKISEEKFLHSHNFTFNGKTWRISVQNEENTNHYGVYVEYDGEEDLYASVLITVDTDRAGLLDLRLGRHQTKVHKEQWNQGWGFKKGFPKDFRGDIKISLDILCYGEKNVHEIEPKETNTVVNINEKFETMFRKNILSDFEVHVKDKVYKCHRAVLSTHSEVFASMFKHKVSENLEGTSILTQ